MFHASRERAESLVVTDAEHTHDARSNGITRGRDSDPLAVTTAVDATGDRVGETGSESGLQFTREFVERDHRSHDLEHRLQEVDVDDLADSRVQRDHRGERGGDAGDFVGECDRRQHRWAVRIATDGGEPCHRLGDRGEAGSLCVGAGLAEPGDAHDDELRIRSKEVVGVQTESLEHAGSEVLDEHVGFGDQPAHEGKVVVVLEVECDGLLVPIDEFPPQALAVAWVAPRHSTE